MKEKNKRKKGDDNIKMYVGKKIMRKNVCVLTDFSVQPNTGKYTLARFF